MFHGYHFGEGILKNKILLVSALALAMGMNAAQAVEKSANAKTVEVVVNAKEGANKQVISSQADSLIKISRIWADFFPANTSNQPI